MPESSLSSLRELTPAILLIIEIVFFEEGVAAFLKASFAPVAVPEGNYWPFTINHELFTVNHFLCPFAGGVDLVEGLPT